MKKLCIAAALAATVCAAGAQNLKPGLWDITSKIGSGNPQMEQAMAQMQKQMAAMPPEQRKMMEEMMAKQGVQLGGPASGGGMTAKVCMTREMVERNELPSGKGDCKTTTQQRTGNTMKMAFTCTQPPSSGDGEVTFVSPEAYTMKMAVNSSMRGKAETMTIEGAGKWLGADCGAIKPLGGAPK